MLWTNATWAIRIRLQLMEQIIVGVDVTNMDV